MAVNVGQGTILKATISSVLTAIAQVLEISGPDITTGAKETTNLGSTSKSRRAQLPDTGPITFTIQYDPSDTTHQFLLTQINTWPQGLVAWELVFNTSPAHNYSFNAFISKLSPKGMNEEDNLEADIELTISGIVTFT